LGGTVIHPTAIVHPKAVLGRGVELGPYCVVGEHVSLGDGTTVAPHAVLEGWTEIGKGCRIGVGAVIGAPPQDKKYGGARSWVRIGDRNVIREYVTIHRAADPDGETRIGDDNFLMAFVHVAHNCRIGNHTVITNLVGLAGHITIEDYAGLGGMTAFHQHVRVGAHAFVGGNCGVRMDVVPFALASGEPLRVLGLNREGLKRHGFTPEQQRVLKAAFRVLFWSGLPVSEATARLKVQFAGDANVSRLIRFVEGSKRGITPGISVGAGRRGGGSDAGDGEEIS
jgi:UDP-N-acetylglucosamine acyltransferase